jgi:hypothetical protein
MFPPSATALSYDENNERIDRAKERLDQLIATEVKR